MESEGLAWIHTVDIYMDYTVKPITILTYRHDFVK